MEAILDFLVDYEVWIYALVGGIAFIYLRKLIISWQDWRTAVFGLERDNAQRRFSSAIAAFGLLAGLILAQFIVVSFVAPSYPGTNYLLTPTIDLLATPTATLAPDTEGGEPPTPEPTYVLSGTGCTEGQIEWSYPLPGYEINGTIELTGTVNVEDFGFYKYEYNQIGSDAWLTIAAGNEKVIDGVLGEWNTNQLNTGDYQLRIIVVDSNDTEYPACEIPVMVTSYE